MYRRRCVKRGERDMMRDTPRVVPIMLSGFHPLVSRWFLESIGEPTPAQRRGWDAIRSGRHTLIAAPTGSGKTLAAFLTAIDELVREGCASPLADEVRVVYVSPLKALSADIHKNLAEPRRGIRRLGEESGLDVPRLTAAVRTGDTTSSERAAMLKTPPHILVTTPESLYLLLTAERSRQMLRAVRTVIVDEIHAVIGTRRGSHLALTLERLEAVCAESGSERPRLQRIGLSATQKPIEDVARFLVGNDEHARRLRRHRHRAPPRDGCGHRGTALAAHRGDGPRGVGEYYDRLAELIAEHKTTLVFVNTRRLAERVARHLADRLGDESVTAHHGSLSKERRLDAEHRLKSGSLKALVATASLELGIDIGHVDLVCQIGSPHRIATLLQRVGRSGHSIAGVPKGRLFPESLRRSGRVRGAPSRVTPRRAGRHRVARCAARRARATDYGGDIVRGMQRRRPVHAHTEKRGHTASCRAPTSMPSSRWCPMGSPRRADDGRRSCTGTKSIACCAAGADRGCSRWCRVAPFLRSPTTGWCSSPKTRSSAR